MRRYFLADWGHWYAAVYVTIDPSTAERSYRRIHRVWRRNFPVGLRGPVDLADPSIEREFEEAKEKLVARGYVFRT